MASPKSFWRSPSHHHPEARILPLSISREWNAHEKKKVSKDEAEDPDSENPPRILGMGIGDIKTGGCSEIRKGVRIQKRRKDVSSLQQRQSPVHQNLRSLLSRYTDYVSQPLWKVHVAVGPSFDLRNVSRSDGCVPFFLPISKVVMHNSL